MCAEWRSGADFLRLLFYWGRNRCLCTDGFHRFTASIDHGRLVWPALTRRLTAAVWNPAPSFSALPCSFHVFNKCRLMTACLNTCPLLGKQSLKTGEVLRAKKLRFESSVSLHQLFSPHPPPHPPNPPPHHLCHRLVLDLYPVGLSPPVFLPPPAIPPTPPPSVPPPLYLSDSRRVKPQKLGEREDKRQKEGKNSARTW